MMTLAPALRQWLRQETKKALRHLFLLENQIHMLYNN